MATDLLGFMPIDPLDEEDTLLQAPQAFQTGAQALEDKIVSDQKEARRATRQNALQALGAALTTFASKDPGRTAARFIEQQVAQRQRKLEMERNELMIQKRWEHQSSENKKGREHQSDLQEDSQEYSTEARKDEQGYRTQEREAGQEFRVGEREASEEFAVSQSDKDYLRDLGMTRLRFRQQQILQGEQIGAADRRAQESQRLELYSRAKQHALEMTGDEMAAERIGQHAVQAWTGEAAPDAETLTVMESMKSQHEEMQNLKIASSQAGLVAAATELATTAGHDGVKHVNQAKFEETLTSLLGEEQASKFIKDPQAAAMAVVHDSVTRASKGEKLDPTEIAAGADAVIKAGGGIDEVHTYLDKVNASPRLRKMITGTEGEAPEDPDKRPNAWSEFAKRGFGFGDTRSKGTQDHQLWEGEYRDTPVGMIVQHPDNPSVFMLRGEKSFTAFGG